MKKQFRTVANPPAARERILHAAMDSFMELGYAQASTLKIATRAQVSKRELYALFGSKQAMLAACIADRAGRMRLPTDLPPPRNLAELEAMLCRLGATVLREVTHPGVMAVFRLAIMESQRAPEVAATLESARQLIGAAVNDILAQAQSAGLIGAGDPSEMAARYLASLWGDLMVSILLRVREAPGARQIEHRARQATEDLLRLYSKPIRPARQIAPGNRSKRRR